MTDSQGKSINSTRGGNSPVTSEVDSFLADLRQRRRSVHELSCHNSFARGRLIFGLDRWGGVLGDRGAASLKADMRKVVRFRKFDSDVGSGRSL